MTLDVQHLFYQANNKLFINDVSLTFTCGNIYGILGPNGAGKSTLLRLLAGVWVPTGGGIFWNQQDLLLSSRRTHSCIVSLVPHAPQIHFDYTVRELVEMGRYAAGGNGSDNAVNAALERTDLCGLVDRPIAKLSSGERQRVYLARSLATESPILLLDEPTANLDISHRVDIWRILRALKDEGKIIVTALHNLAAAERLCDEVIVLNRGACVGVGKFGDVMNGALLNEVFRVENLAPLECD